MVRQSLKKKDGSHSDHFKLRGKDHTRIEGLSDGVFAIAIALLLISSDIPETFDELKEFMLDFVPFAATITLLMLLWYEHYTFFIRYGLKDATTVFLNTILLFLILFYVYPLKFLFKTLFQLFSGLITRDREKLEHLFTYNIHRDDTATLMIIYGIGAAVIFLTFALLYNLALKRKQTLELKEFEIFQTKSSIYSNLVSASIPLGSALIAATGIGGKDNFTLSGIFYWTYGIAMPVYYKFYYRKRKKLFPETMKSPVKEQEPENEG